MNMTFGEKLKAIRIEKKMSQEELATLLGTSKQVISRYETNQRTPKITVVSDYANILDVPLNYLLDNSIGSLSQIIGDTSQISRDAFDISTIANIHPVQLKKIPLLGEIACGEPIYAEENKEHYIMANSDVRADFCLKAKGDSMINADIHEGDIVFIRSQSIVDDGEIAVVIIDDEATLKRVYFDENSITLVAENPKYRPMVYTDYALDEIRILGKAISIQRDIL